LHVIRSVGLALSLLSAGAHAQSLREAIETAIQANPDVAVSVSRRGSALEQVEQSRAGYLPRVDASVGYGYQQLDSIQSRALGRDKDWLWRQSHSLTLTQMLFDADATRASVNVARARLDAADYRVTASIEDLALRVVGAYLEVLRRQQTVALATENLAKHEALHELIRKRTESGVGRRADFEQAEARLALARAALREERGQAQNAEVSYLRLLRKAPQSLRMPAPPADLMPGTLAAALDTAFDRNPGLRSAKAGVTAALAQRDGARAAFMPRVDLEIQGNHDNNAVISRTYDTTALVRLRYNLYRGGADEARLRETAYLIEESQRLLEGLQRETEETVSLAFVQHTTAKERNVELAKYVAAATATREAYAGQFDIGQRTLLDLLNAENELYSARLQQITGYFTEIATIYRVLAGVGILRETVRDRADASGPSLDPQVTAAAPGGSGAADAAGSAGAQGGAPGWALSGERRSAQPTAQEISAHTGRPAVGGDASNQ